MGFGPGGAWTDANPHNNAVEVVVVKQAMIAALVIGAVFLGACGGRQPAQQPAPPPAAEQPATPAPSSGGRTVQVKMSEFKYEAQPRGVPAGAVTFEIENAGTVEHDFIIQGVDKGTEQLRPGQKATLTVDLKPGTYTVVCNVAGHKEAGMTMELVVK